MLSIENFGLLVVNDLTKRGHHDISPPVVHHRVGRHGPEQQLDRPGIQYDRTASSDILDQCVSKRRAPRWNPRTGEVDSNPSGVLDGGTAVNRYGWRVGRETLNRPVLNYDGGRLSLPDLGHPGQPGNRAVTVSDDGRTIAGQVSTGNGAELAAVVWRCQ